MSTSPAAALDSRTKRNVAVLAFAHAGLGAQLALNIIVAGLAGALCAAALFVGSFGLFLAGALLLGVYQAMQSFFRFAAADAPPDHFKPKATPWVLAGGRSTRGSAPR